MFQRPLFQRGYALGWTTSRHTATLLLQGLLRVVIGRWRQAKEANAPCSASKWKGLPVRCSAFIKLHSRLKWEEKGDRDVSGRGPDSRMRPPELWETDGQAKHQLAESYQSINENRFNRWLHAQNSAPRVRRRAALKIVRFFKFDKKEEICIEIKVFVIINILLSLWNLFLSSYLIQAIIIWILS